MRAGGLLCRSEAATAVCVPGDARSMVLARRADRTIVDDARALHDVRYARLGAAGDGRRSTSTSRRFATKQAAPPPPPAVVCSGASCKPRAERRPVAVTLPMVSKSPSKEAPAKEIAAAAKRAGALAAPGDQVLQVVVMRVAIHCQGCAGKVRKHISKMEGVTSFSIDLESKKVTVMGHVSPAGVLHSISKVKKAELLLAA